MGRFFAKCSVKVLLCEYVGKQKSYMSLSLGLSMSFFFFFFGSEILSFYLWKDQKMEETFNYSEKVFKYVDYLQAVPLLFW